MTKLILTAGLLLVLVACGERKAADTGAGTTMGDTAMMTSDSAMMRDSMMMKDSMTMGDTTKK